MVNNVLRRRPAWCARGLGCRAALRARALLLSLALVLGGAVAAAETILRPIATDWRTGLALHGFDPVAYFAEGKALPGSPEFESEVAGGTWRFRSEGNMTAFGKDPAAYAPRFAGCDPVAVGRGVATAGNPLVWVIHEGRLLLFFDEAARRAFARDPPGALAAAESAWPTVQKALSP